MHASGSLQAVRASCLFPKQVRQAPLLSFSRQLSVSMQSSSSSTSTVAAAAAASTQPQEASTEESLVYDAEYSADYVNYHCVTGTLRSLQFTQEKDAAGADVFWTTFVLQVVVSSGAVDDYRVYVGGAAGSPAHALARDIMNKLAEGDYLQIGGAMLLGGPSGPKLFAHSIGKIAALPSPADQVQFVETPALPAHIAATAFGAPASQRWQQAGGGAAAAGAAAAAAAPDQAAGAPPAGAAPAAAAAPIDPPGMPAEPSTEHEALWMSLFQENHRWTDRRQTRTGKQPDFFIQGGPALWVEDRRTPAWAKAALHLLPGNQPYAPTLPDFIPASAATGSNLERAWVAVFTEYSAFWDNRLTKLNPRGPDFKAKDKSVDTALWIDSKGTPGWVLNNLDKLPPAPPPRA